MKNRLGKVTFGLLCSFLVVYLLYNVYSLWTFFKMMGDWETFIYMCNTLKFTGLISIIHNFLVGPTICWAIGLIYTIIIGKGKPVNRFVYMITALAVFDNLFFAIFPFDKITGFFYIFMEVFFWFILIAYCICFVLLFVQDKKQKNIKTIRIALISTYICTFVYGIIGFIYNIARHLIVSTEIVFYNVCSIFLWNGLRFVLFVIGGLVLGYILFHQKYFKKQE